MGVSTGSALEKNDRIGDEPQTLCHWRHSVYGQEDLIHEHDVIIDRVRLVIDMVSFVMFGY